MRCPKCDAVVPGSAMLWSDAFRGFHCAECGTPLQATYLSRLVLLGTSLVLGILAAAGSRAMGAGRLVVVLAAVVTLLAVYIGGAGFVPRVKILRARPGGPA